MKALKYLLCITICLLNTNHAVALDSAESINSIDPPAICDQIVILPNSFKTLCHIKANFSYVDAQNICQSNGMELFDVTSSPAAKTAIVSYTKEAFNGNSKARVYVKGEKSGQCLTYSGAGKSSYKCCNSTYNPICEFNIKPKTIPCVTGINYEDTLGSGLMGICAISSIDFPRTIALNPISSNPEQIDGINIYPPSDFSFLPVFLAEIFPGLKYLTTDYVGITEISEINFRGLFGLESLYMDNSKITKIPKGAFQDLVSLTDFRNDYGKVEIIYSGTFSNQNKLSGISFYQNSIHTVEKGAFKGLKSLRYLSLSDNKLQSIDKDLFKGLTTLEVLSLNGNLIESIPKDLFKGMKLLYNLGFGGNKLTTIQNGTFDGLTSLKWLNLYGNKFEAITVGMFGKNLSNMFQFNLMNNLIKTIEKGSFRSMPNLYLLHLDGNLLESINKDMFEGLQNLGALGLDSNRIKSIAIGTFADITKAGVNLELNVCVNKYFRSTENIAELLPGTLAPDCI